jgi:hypothetical protein
MKIATVILLLIIIILAACTGIISTSTTSAQSSNTPTSGNNLSSSTTTPLIKTQAGTNQGAVIVLKQSGGFAGKTQKWTIYADGQITMPTGKGAQLSQEELTNLLQKIDRLGFYTLQSSYMPLNTCCDRITYELSVTDGGKTNTVIYLEGAAEVPSSLWEITEAVNQFVNK